MKGSRYVAAISAAIVAMALAYKFPAEFFIAFTVGWIFIIPALFVGYLAYGLWAMRKDNKNRIVVQTKPSAAMQAILRRELELQKEKELLKMKNF
jgi:predicted membrane protein